MKDHRIRSFSAFASKWGFLACALALAGALAGCSLQPADADADENAAANRQFIAQLNNRTEELGTLMESFQKAVAEDDAVSMKAAADGAARIVDGVKAMEAPKPAKGSRTKDSSGELNAVKDRYVQGMEQLGSAMDSYASLYTELGAENLSSRETDRKLAVIQKDYDKAIEALAEADALLSDLGNDTNTASSKAEEGSSGDAAASAAASAQEQSSSEAAASSSAA